METENKTADLVRQAMSGDKSAFLSLVQLHKAITFSLIYQNAPTASDVEDIAQEAFLRAFQALPRLRSPELFGKWLYGIAMNVAREHRRERGPTVSLESIPDQAAPTPDAAEEDRENRLMLAVSQLPDKYRIPLTLFYVNDLNYHEIGRHIGVNSVTARSLVHRARAKLRVIMESDR